jgi:RNA polymerase sigma-70 factor (sigma-E family)
VQDADMANAGAELRPTKRQSFEQFVVSRSAGLLGTAYLLTQDRALAEDLLQTALAKSWRAWDRIEASPDAYVRRVLINTYATWWRRRWNTETPMATLPEVSLADQDAASIREVRDALARLPKRQRAALVLRFFDDQTESETARILGCSVGTVKSQVSKALAKLRVDPALADWPEGREGEARR